MIFHVFNHRADLLVINLLNGFLHFRQFLNESFQVLDVKIFDILSGFFAHDDVENVQDRLFLFDLLINRVDSLHGVIVPADGVLVTDGVVEATTTVLVMLKLSNLWIHL